MTADELAAIVREHTERAIQAALGPAIQVALSPVLEEKKALEMRILELETRPAALGPPGTKGDPGPKGADGAGIALLLLSAEGRLMAHLTDGRTLDIGAIPKPTDGKDGAAGLNGKDGQSITIGDVQPLIAAEVQKAIAACPRPTDGRDGKDAPPVDLEAMAIKVASLIPAPKDGRDGKDAPPIDLDALAAKAASLMPTPKDGRDGKDGIGLTGALIDREDRLVLTFSDGQTKAIGVVVGRDGANGLNGQDVDLDRVTTQIHEAIAAIPRPKDGRDVDMLEVKRLILDEVAKIPIPKDGQDGKDGRDGIPMEWPELDCDEQGWVWRLRGGDRVEEKRLGFPFAVGPWEAGKAYVMGAGVAWDGGWWIAKQDTTSQPGSDRTWQLCVRRGKQGKPGEPGKPGKDGQDFRPSNTPPLYGA